MNQHIPSGYEHDSADPEKFVLRCPDCGRNHTRSSRPGKGSQTCPICNRLMGVTPISRRSTPDSEAEGAMTDGGQEIDEDGDVEDDDCEDGLRRRGVVHGGYVTDGGQNPNREIEGATWNQYEKQVATWAVKLPVEVQIPTREGTVEADGGDYLCIDSDGGLYPCDADTFEKMYRPVGLPDDVPMTDGGVDPDPQEVLAEFTEHIERQTEAQEHLAEQLEIQNAVLFQLVHAQQRANMISMGRDPADTPTPESRASAVQDGVLQLAEQVDVDEARRWVDR